MFEMFPGEFDFYLLLFVSRGKICAGFTLIHDPLREKPSIYICSLYMQIWNSRSPYLSRK